jgi:hypothetical protein
MTKKKIIRIGLFTVLGAVIVSTGFTLYLFNKPHRNIQAAAIDFTVSSRALVDEYLSSPERANEKYLSDEGNSKVLAIKGKVHATSRDLNGQVVLLLKDANDKAGVSCTFTEATNGNASRIQPGQEVKVKGVIRSGAGYDEDLELYEDVIVEKCDILFELK